MKTADFRGELKPNGQIAVPPEIASQVPPGEQIQVVLQWGISEDDAWRATGRRQFDAAYAADDSVYEQLIHDSSTR
jgi:GH35 family endo-1,4-beta-xylanase